MDKLPIADIMMLDLNQAGAVEDQSNQMRTYMFCMDMENVGRELKECHPDMNEESFVWEFIAEIQKCSGYRGFTSFCEVDIDGLKDIGGKVFKLLQ